MLLLFIFYQSLQLLMFPLICASLLLRKIKGKSVFGNIWQRFGFIPKISKHRESFWVHAVSVGEIISTQEFIKKLKIKHPTIAIYVTTGTVSGKKIAEQQLQADYVSFLPYDFLFPMILAFKRIRPKTIIIMEAEIWPNFLVIARLKKIPLYLFNARINTTSKFRFLLQKIFFAPMFKMFTHIFTQAEKDILLFKKMNVSMNNVSILGNIKAYNVIAKKRHFTAATTFCNKQKINQDNKILLCGSIHLGELNLFLRIFKKLKQKDDSIKMILAPRHFNWKQELLREVKSTEWSFFLWDHENDLIDNKKNLSDVIMTQIFNKHDILLTCVMGKLFTLYPLATLFFLGGTFVPVGGHNLFEPAVWGNPIIIGPYYQNTIDIADRLSRVGGLIKVRNEQELLLQSNRLFQDNNARLKIGQEASIWLKKEEEVVSQRLECFFEKLQTISSQKDI